MAQVFAPVNTTIFIFISPSLFYSRAYFSRLGARLVLYPVLYPLSSFSFLPFHMLYYFPVAFVELHNVGLSGAKCHESGVFSGNLQEGVRKAISYLHSSME